MGMTFLDEINNKLETLEKKVSKEITENALIKGSEPILESQIETVPVEKGPEGGKLRISLVVKVRSSGSGAKKKNTNRY